VAVIKPTSESVKSRTSMSIQENIIPHNHSVARQDRSEKYGYQPYLLWFTGLSGSGKSTLASALEVRLFEEGFHTYILDGDNVRVGLNQDLDFTDEGRKENIRRIAEVSRLFLDAGNLVITAFISPFKEDRAQAKEIVGEEGFIEVFVDTPLHICESRDVKGLYGKARKGEIKNFTGIDSPFEAPDSPQLHIKTENKSVEDSVEELYKKFKELIKRNEQ
jgi:adenylylsulfate kinase